MSTNSGIEDIKFNGAVVSCKDDRDCPLNTICYFPFPNAPKQGQCGCSVEFGEVGNACDQLSKASYFRLATFIMMILFSFVLFLFVLRDIYILKSTKRFNLLDAKSTTLVQVAITMIAICITQIAGILSVFDHYNVSIVPDIIEGFRKVRAYSIVRDIATAFICFFYAASALNIGLLWLEVAIASKKFQTMSSAQVKKKYRWFIAIFNTLMFITVVIALRVNPPLGVLATIPFALLLCLIYIYSVIAISKVINAKTAMRLVSSKTFRNSKNGSSIINLDPSQSNPHISTPSSGMDSPLKVNVNANVTGSPSSPSSPSSPGKTGVSEAKINSSLRRTQFCAAWVISCTFMIVVFIALSGVLGNRARTQARPNGTIYPALATTFLAALFANLGCCGIVWYVHLTVRKALIGDSSKTASSADKPVRTPSKQAQNVSKNSNFTEGSVVIPRTPSKEKMNGSLISNDPELLEKL